MTQSELKVVLDCLEAIERRRIIDELQKEAKFQVDGFQGKASNAPNDRVAMSLMRRQHAYSLFQSKVKLLCPELDDIYRDGYSREKALDILSRNNAAAVGLSILVQEGHLDDNVLQRLKATNIPATIEEQANACCPGKCEILKTEKDANKQLRKRLREAKELAQDREKNIAELKAALREKEEYVMELVNLIKKKFEDTPSDLDGIRELLAQRKFTAEELAEIAVDFTDECFCEYHDALDPEIESVTIENMHSNYVFDAINLLLEAGLDPNTVVNDDNAIWNAMYIDAPNVAASVMRLLLEKGGNPNHIIPAEGESLFENIDFSVSYDEYTHKYFHTVQCWLVLMAYGACWPDGGIPITMLGDNSIEIFKEFERYDYEIEPLPQEPNKYGCWIMHIFDKETREEVAVYR